MNTKRIVDVLSGLSGVAGQLSIASQEAGCGGRVTIRQEWLKYAADGIMESVEILTEEIFDEAMTAEREACAKIAESWAGFYPVGVFPEDGESLDCKSASVIRLIVQHIAGSIRAREG